MPILSPAALNSRSLDLESDVQTEEADKFHHGRQLALLLHGTEVNECTVKSRETGRWAALVCQQQQLD